MLKTMLFRRAASGLLLLVWLLLFYLPANPAAAAPIGQTAATWDATVYLGPPSDQVQVVGTKPDYLSINVESDLNQMCIPGQTFTPDYSPTDMPLTKGLTMDASGALSGTCKGGGAVTGAAGTYSLSGSLNGQVTLQDGTVTITGSSDYSVDMTGDNAFHAETHFTYTGKGKYTPDASGQPTTFTDGTLDFKFHDTCDKCYAEPVDLSYTDNMPLIMHFWPNASSPAIESKYRLSVVNINHDPGQPLNYEPLSFQITLEAKGSDGEYKPAAGEIIKVVGIDPGIASDYFQDSGCPKCDYVLQLGKKFDIACTSPCEAKNIELKTDARGQAWITYYLDMAKLVEEKKVPTPATPFKGKLEVVYETGSGANKTILAQVDSDVTLDAVGIVEKVEYVNPTILLHTDSGDKESTWSEKPMDITLFVEDTGSPVGEQTLKGADRVRKGGANFNEEDLSTSQALKPSDLLHVDDKLFMDACELPKPTIPEGKNAQIAVQARYFDGVEMRVSVQSVVCSEEFSIGKAYEETKAGFLGTVYGYLVELAVGKVAEKGIHVVAHRMVPYFEAGHMVHFLFGFMRETTGGEPVFVQLNSTIYVEAGGADQDITITSREGSPVVYTSATGQDGVTVPAGKTATIPDNLVPDVQDTDAAMIASADVMISQMQTAGEPSQAQPASLPVSSSGNSGSIIIIIAACGCLFTIGLVGGGMALVVTRSRRKKAKDQPAFTNSPARANPPAVQPVLPAAAGFFLARLVVVRGLASQPGIELPAEGLVIGRNPAALLVLQDGMVSSNHFQVTWENGAWVAADLNSTNGTYVNGVRITRQVLRPGDQIQAGQTVVVFQVL